MDEGLTSVGPNAAEASPYWQAYHEGPVASWAFPVAPVLEWLSAHRVTRAETLEAALEDPAALEALRQSLHFTAINAATCTLFGLQSGDRLVQQLRGCYDRPGLAATAALLLQAADSRVVHFSSTLQRFSLEERELWVAYILPDRADGYLVAQALDLTEIAHYGRRLEERDEHLRRLTENISDVICTFDEGMRLRYVSPSLREWFDSSVASVNYDQIYRTLGRVIAPAGAALMRNGHHHSTLLQTTLPFAPNDLRPVEVKLSTIHQRGRRSAGGVIAVMRDCSERYRWQQDLQLAAKVFENSQEGIFITDAKGFIAQVNPAFERITGYPAEEAIGKRPRFLRSGLHGRGFFQRLRPELLREGYWEGELVNRRQDGSMFPAQVSLTVVRDAREELVGCITSFRDISDAKASEERIRKLAYFDPLTDLPNRALLADRLAHELDRSAQKGQVVALLFLDLDGFKAVNDSMGHDAGDVLLRQVAARLQGAVHPDDTVARMGGDEFTIVLGGCNSGEHAERSAVAVALKVMKALTEPFRIKESEVFISTSIGIALYPQDAMDGALLLRNADIAMYHAKNAGKNSYQFYQSSMNERALARLELQSNLHRAVAKGDFQLHYQPLADLHGGTWGGVECLLRWQHPRHGWITPEEFLPIAEESGLSVSIGAWVFDQAFAQLARWQRQGTRVPRLSINLSTRQFMDPDLLQVLIRALERHQLSARQLMLEVTEASLMRDPQYALGVLQDLRAMGVALAVDDFGTGYSSLAHLRDFPLDTLKVDRRFIRHLHQAEDERRIAAAVVALARSFGLQVAAEGVERQDQLEVVCQLGIDQAQGYLLARPMAPLNLQESLSTPPKLRR